MGVAKGDGAGDNLFTMRCATSALYMFLVVISLLLKSFLFLCLSYLINLAFWVGEDPANLFDNYEVVLSGVVRFVFLDTSFSFFNSSLRGVSF